MVAKGASEATELTQLTDGRRAADGPTRTVMLPKRIRLVWWMVNPLVVWLAVPGDGDLHAGGVVGVGVSAGGEHCQVVAAGLSAASGVRLVGEAIAAVAGGVGGDDGDAELGEFGEQGWW